MLFHSVQKYQCSPLTAARSQKRAVRNPGRSSWVHAGNLSLTICWCLRLIQLTSNKRDSSLGRRRGPDGEDEIRAWGSLSPVDLAPSELWKGLVEALYEWAIEMLEIV